jgi:hypothetical protein
VDGSARIAVRTRNADVPVTVLDYLGWLYRRTVENDARWLWIELTDENVTVRRGSRRGGLGAVLVSAPTRLVAVTNYHEGFRRIAMSLHFPTENRSFYFSKRDVEAARAIRSALASLTR